MITIEHFRERFYAGERTEEVRVAVGDDVVVTSGDHDGKLGAAISLETLGPALAVLIEFRDGSDARARRQHSPDRALTKDRIERRDRTGG